MKMVESEELKELKKKKDTLIEIEKVRKQRLSDCEGLLDNICGLLSNLKDPEKYHEYKNERGKVVLIRTATRPATYEFYAGERLVRKHEYERDVTDLSFPWETDSRFYTLLASIKEDLDKTNVLRDIEKLTKELGMSS